MHSSIVLSFAGLLSFASAEIAANTPAEGLVSVRAGQQIDGSVSFHDGSVSSNKSRHDTVIFAADQYATTTITATVFATDKNTVSAYNTTLMAPQGASNVTATVSSVNPDPSECVCLRTPDDEDEGHEEICSECFPDGGYGNLPSWREDSLVQPSITKAVDDLEDTRSTILANSSSGIEGPMSTSMLRHTNTTVAYRNESSTVGTTVVSATLQTASLTSTAHWSSDFRNSTIPGSSAPTNAAAVGRADASSSGYMVSPKAKHSLAFWVAMWAVLALQIEGSLAGLW